jgi:hypothetical protein
VSYCPPPPCLAGSLTVVGARPPPFAPSPPAALAEAGPVNAGRARVTVDHARTVSVGQAPLCIWAERGFGPETLKLIFSIF